MRRVVHRSTATRPSAGARRVFGLTLGLLLAAAGTSTARVEESLGPLPWRSTGKVGFTVDAAVFPETVGDSLEVYVRVPPSTLAALELSGGGEKHLRVLVKVRNSFGASQNAAQEIDVTPSDSIAGFGKVVLLRFGVKPGKQRLNVRLEDVHSRKKGFAYMGRNVTEASEIEGTLEVAGASNGQRLSDLEYAWIEDSVSTPGAFVRAGRRVIPNPERLFGLFATDFKAFFRAAGPPGEPHAWASQARLLDGKGRIVAEQDSVYEPAQLLEGSVGVDLTHEPAGGYDLEVKVWNPNQADTLTRRTRWGVAWLPGAWLRSARAVEDEVHFLLTPEDEDSFALMNPGEQERFLEAFWLKRDPTPGTGANEARDEFLRRVALANRAYSRRGSVPGMFSDMGRVFIRYGEPSEVLKQVVPSGDNTLAQMIAELSATEDRDVGDVHQKGLGGDIRPYEVWIYEGLIPRPPDADPDSFRPLRRRMVFLFVDDQGVGDYRLRYSTE